MSTVRIKTLAAPPFDEKEALIYAGCKVPDDLTLALLRETKDEIWELLSYKVCFLELPLKADGDVLDFGCFKVKSTSLSKNLEGSEKVLLFGATVGINVDRLIAKYGKISPSRALMVQSIGAERIEALCDAFCREFEVENGVKLRQRFSPGYGDLDVTLQKEIFSVLDCPKKIGLSISSSFMMTPSKSVTAFAGITEQE